MFIFLLTDCENFATIKLQETNICFFSCDNRFYIPFFNLLLMLKNLDSVYIAKETGGKYEL